MNVREKLDVFSRLVMSEAEEKRDKILAEVSEAFKTACEEAERRARKNADGEIKNECYKIEQIKNRKFVGAAAQSKKSMIELKDQLMFSLRGNIERMLRQFVASGEYEAYLTENIKLCAEKYGGMDVLLMERDMVYAEKIRAAAGANIIQTDKDFIGGFKAIVQGGRVLIDHSFATRLDAEINDFNQFKIT